MRQAPRRNEAMDAAVLRVLAERAGEWIAAGEVGDPKRVNWYLSKFRRRGLVERRSRSAAIVQLGYEYRITTAGRRLAAQLGGVAAA